MKQEKLWREFSSLSPELQQQVADFIAFLRKRKTVSSGNTAIKRVKLSKEPFIGMWRDRQDFNDSTAWVRQVRQREWTHRDD